MSSESSARYVSILCAVYGCTQLNTSVPRGSSRYVHLSKPCPQLLGTKLSTSVESDRNGACDRERAAKIFDLLRIGKRKFCDLVLASTLYTMSELQKY